MGCVPAFLCPPSVPLPNTAACKHAAHHHHHRATDSPRRLHQHQSIVYLWQVLAPTLGGGGDGGGGHPKSKNFGGHGAPSGKKDKGVKNAKRFKEKDGGSQGGI